MLKSNLVNYLVFLCLLSFALAGCSSGRKQEAEIDVLKKQVSEMKGQIEVFRVAAGEMSVSTEKLSKSNKNLFDLQQQMLEMIKGLQDDDIKKREIEKEKADLSKKKTELLKTRIAEMAARRASVVIGSLLQSRLDFLRRMVIKVDEGAELKRSEVESLTAMFGRNSIFQNYFESKSAKKGESRNSRDIIKEYTDRRIEIEGLLETKGEILNTEEYISDAVIMIGELNSQEFGRINDYRKKIEEGERLSRVEILSLARIAGSNKIFKEVVESHLALMGEERQSRLIIKAFIDNTPR